MAQEITADLCVIGGGAGGLSVAAGAAQMGARTVLIEAARMGGECLNTACVPSKAFLIAAAEVRRRRHAPEEAWKLAYGRVREAISAIAPQDSPARFTGLGVKVVKARARFVGPRQVEADGIVVNARRSVIATGSAPVIPEVRGLSEVAYLTSENLFDSAPRPESLIIVGAGAMGLELAQAFRRLGAEVTVLEALRCLPQEDAELAWLLADALRAEGVAIIENVRPSEVAPSGRGIKVRYAWNGQSATLQASHLLIASGRKPRFEGLDLDAAGIATEDGRLVLDRFLRTTNRRVFAVGDAAGPPFYTHLASYHAALVLRHALWRLPAKASNDALPRVTYTEPELAHVGLDEGEARARHGAIRVLRWPFAEVDRALIERRTGGLVKVVTTRRGRILGASVLGPRAGDLIHVWTLALGRRLSVGTMAHVLAAYPTFSEASQRAAASFYRARLFSPVAQYLVRWLARLG